MLLPGFGAHPARMRYLARRLEEAGHKVKRWGQGFNLGVAPDTLDQGAPVGTAHSRLDPGDPALAPMGGEAFVEAARPALQPRDRPGGELRQQHLAADEILLARAEQEMNGVMDDTLQGEFNALRAQVAISRGA